MHEEHKKVDAEKTEEGCADCQCMTSEKKECAAEAEGECCGGGCC